MNEQLKKGLIIGACVLVCVLTISTSTYYISKVISGNDGPVIIEALEHVPVNFSTPQYTASLTREEFSAMQDAGLMEQFDTYESYQASGAGADMSYVEAVITASGINAQIYDIVDSNFNVWYADMRVSPILPMAISNVETPGRSDHSVTWSSMFPSAVVPIEYLETFDVTSVISNNAWYNVLSKEYSTRDRGCLQMSPTYGTNNGELNALMSGTEKEKLAQVDTSQYGWWVSGAADKPGDRFYLPDVCLRMTAAMQLQTNNMVKNQYQPTTDMQLIAMLAASHQNSGIWHFADHNKSVGCWKSGDLVYEWCQTISSEAVINRLTELAQSQDNCFIDSNVADSICRELGIDNYSKYATKSIVCTYPIKVLYAYIKLCMLYTN